MVMLIFARLSDLYGSKCKVQALEIHDEENRYTTQFKLWCRAVEVEGLTLKQIATGFQRLEFISAHKARIGEEAWPPSYAGFIGHCTSGWETAAHKPFQPLALPSKTDAEYKADGRARLAKMRAELGI